MKFRIKLLRFIMEYSRKKCQKLQKKLNEYRDIYNKSYHGIIELKKQL